MLATDMGDGSICSFDRVRRQFIITAKGGAVITVGSIPARPNPPNAGAASGSATGAAAAAPAEKLTPVTKTGFADKLGHRKQPITGAAIWNRRYMKLTANELIYQVGENDATPKGTIDLNPGCQVRVVQSNEPARKDRYEDNDNPGVMALATMNIGTMMEKCSGPIGKDCCVELHVPVQVANMLGNVMGNSAVSLAFGGGIDKIKKNLARTYYFACDNNEVANEWAAALKNNISILVQGTTSGSDGMAATAGAVRGANGAVNLGALNGMMNMAMGYQADMKNMQDPNESLGWFKRNLQTDLPLDALYTRVIGFYDELAKIGVRPTY